MDYPIRSKSFFYKYFPRRIVIHQTDYLPYLENEGFVDKQNSLWRLFSDFSNPSNSFY